MAYEARLAKRALLMTRRGRRIETRKQVGSARRTPLQRLEELNRFVERHAPQADDDGEPIRKVVGRARPRRD